MSPAVVKIWDIKTRLDRVIDYAVNEEKTNDKYYVSGINCQPEFAYEQMYETKKQFTKTTGILGFHAYQSFLKGEIEPELAHKIGLEFAEKMWGNRFEIVVATHTGGSCIHNHFCLNSVSFEDGKKYYDNKDNYKRMREISDNLCREYGLSVIENPGKGSPEYTQYTENKVTKFSKDNIIKRDIDECILECISPKGFYRNMQKRGYTFNFNRKYPTVSHPGFERPRRLKNLGPGYSPEEIEQRVMESLRRYEIVLPQQESPVSEYLIPLFEPTYKEIYVAFISVVKAVKENPDGNREIQKYLTEESRKLDKLIEQQNLLCDNDIETPEQLIDFKNSCKDEIEKIVNAREILYKRKIEAEKSNDKEALIEIKNDISLYNERLKILRKDIRICERIEKQKPEIDKKISQLKEREYEKIRAKEVRQMQSYRGRWR